MRCDCTNKSPCGKTSRYRCLKRRLKECETCTLVKSRYAMYRMIDRKPVKICIRCGKAKPLTAYYPKTIHSHGHIYQSTESMCKMCRSEHRYEKLAQARASPEL